MKTISILIAGLSLLAVPAVAAVKTKTVTVDRPKVMGTRTSTIDTRTHTRERDTSLTRKSDGATATRHVTRQRDGNVKHVSGGSQSFNGTVRTFDRTVTRPTAARRGR